LKTKLSSHVQVVKDDKDEVTKREDQLDELINSYRIGSSTKLEEDLISMLQRILMFVLILMS
jgi:hypothetical protein